MIEPNVASGLLPKCKPQPVKIYYLWWKLEVLLILALVLSGCVIEIIGDHAKPASVSERQNAHLKLARGYYRLGKYQRAHEVAERALAIRRRSADAHEVMALIEAALSRPRAARVHFKRSVRLQRSNSRIWNNYGVFLYHQGDFAAACQAFKRAVADPDYSNREEAVRSLEHCRAAQSKPP